MRLLVLALSLIAAACAVPEREARLDPDPWPRPPTSSAQVRRDLAGALARKDGKAVTRGLVDLARMGAHLSPETQGRLAPLLDRSAVPADWPRSGDLARTFADHFRYNETFTATGEAFAEIPAEHRLIEGIAYDSASGRLFAGSVVDRRLLVRDSGNWREVQAAAPLGGVFGLAIDSERRLLWLASGIAEPVPDPATAFAGLVAIDLDRLTEVRRVPVPGSSPGDVAVGGDGTVYASDGRSGAVVRCRPGCAAAEILVPPGILRSPQGMAPWPGDRLLYIADYSLGLVRLDLRTLRLRPVVAREPQMLDGIDGLVRYGEQLIAIQNGTRPPRIVAIALNPGGRVVEDIRVVEQSVPGWGEPTLGTLLDGTLLYVADAQWESYGPGGVLRQGALARATAIRRVYLDAIIVTRLLDDAIGPLGMQEKRFYVR